MKPVDWIVRRYRFRLAIRRLARVAEAATVLTRAPVEIAFFILSTERNAGDAVIRCLDSVHRQRWPRTRTTHVLIDDASTDGTRDRIEAWLSRHPDHCVEFTARSLRAGGTANTIDGMSRAPRDSVVLELNGDDWLPDPGVLPFLARVYADPEVWMTYNTQVLTDGSVPFQLPPPRHVVRRNLWREWPWTTGHLHSFRAALLKHLPSSVMIDPETGEPWERADDRALYWALLELCGTHARHVYRTTYVYNAPHAEVLLPGDSELALRIRRQPRLEPLSSL